VTVEITPEFGVEPARLSLQSQACTIKTATRSVPNHCR